MRELTGLRVEVDLVAGVWELELGHADLGL